MQGLKRDICDILDIKSIDAANVFNKILINKIKRRQNNGRFQSNQTEVS